MKLKLFALVLCTVGISVSEGMELTNNIQKIPSTIQHIPQDIAIDIFHSLDYPILGRSRQVCKHWKTLIDEKLPLPQRYILKYLAQFVQKNNPDRTLKRFEEIFLVPLSDGSLGKTVLDDIIEELQDELSATKEQAYQALLNSQLMNVSHSIVLTIYTGYHLEAKRELAFPYIPANLVKQDKEHVLDRDIRMVIIGQQDSPMQIFGIGNLSAEILGRVAEIDLYKVNLLKIPRQLHKLQRLTKFSLSNGQMSSIPFEIAQLTNLQTLDLHGNQLRSLPAEIGELTNLQELYLDNNQLSSIPAKVGQLTKLQRLCLTKNHVSSIPAEIG